jgi:hypothetical protein
MLCKKPMNLEELGYKVEIGNQYNEWYCIISWK